MARHACQKRKQVAGFDAEDTPIALINITRWPSVFIFLLAGVAAMVFAFSTVNLFSQSFASIGFLREHGWDAVRHGVLVQMTELLASGAVALFSWLTFKVCEHVLEDRYLAWARRERRAQKATPNRDTANPDGDAPPPR